MSMKLQHHWEGRRITGESSHLMVIFIVIIISSPEQEAQVSFSDQNLSVVRCCRCHCCCCCRKLFTFSFSSPEPLGQFQPKLVQNILGSNEGPLLFPRGGRELRNIENIVTNFKNLLLQNHWANFNQS